MQVLSIDYETTPTYKPVTCKADYSMVQRDIYEAHGVLILPWDTLDIQHKGNIIVFTERWECTVTFMYKGAKYYYTYVFEPGFICDKGSVPGWARSYVDNDCPEFLIAFIIHDANYACHFVGVNRLMSDSLLRYMGRYGANKPEDSIKPSASAVKAWSVYRAVRIGGGSAWKKDRQALIEERKFVKLKQRCHGVK